MGLITPQSPARSASSTAQGFDALPFAHSGGRDGNLRPAGCLAARIGKLLNSVATEIGSPTVRNGPAVFGIQPNDSLGSIFTGSEISRLRATAACFTPSRRHSGERYDEPQPIVSPSVTPTVTYKTPMLYIFIFAGYEGDVLTVVEI
jgi:hypothetical protein